MSVIALLHNSRYHKYAAGHFQLKKQNTIQNVVRRYLNGDSQEIIIPKKIPRGPTDILKTLATTVTRDPTAPLYKFHDDPYLIPVSNTSKRYFALSQESGRKAAMWVKEQHPELFQRIEADPPIEAFLTKPSYDEFDDVDEMTLLKTIRTASVNDSIQIYELMLKTNTPISEEAKLCLLELICFFNGEEDLAEALIEERWFSMTASDRKTLKKTWKDNDYAYKLFSELPASARSYSALIMGMVKYLQLEMALKYYEEAVSKGFALSPDAYNAMIKVANFSEDYWENRWKFVENVLCTMNENGCKPTLQTLNRVLEILARNPGITQTKSLALRMIAEVGRFGVKPSIGSYSILLNIFCKVGKIDREPSYILEEILDVLEGKDLTARDIADSLFFHNAMEKCRFYYNNSDIAFRVNRLLWHGKNYNLIGQHAKENAYYRSFFLTLCQSETLKTIMDQYNFYIPHIYSPELAVMEEIVNVVTMNGAVELYPKLWSDIVLFDMSDNSSLVSNLLKGMILNRPPQCTPLADETVKSAETAYAIFSKGEQDMESTKVRVLEWTGEILGDITLLCLCANRYERAKNVFQRIIKSRNKIIGSPSAEAVEMMLDACIIENDTKLAVMIVDYCHDNGYIDDKKYATKVIREMNLSPSYKSHLTAIYGPKILEQEKKKHFE